MKGGKKTPYLSLTFYDVKIIVKCDSQFTGRGGSVRARKTNTSLRKEQIIEAALAAIAAEGVHALSIAGIAERVGIVPSALYRHFRGKDEVLDAILDFIGARLLGNVKAARGESTAALQRLKSLLIRHACLLQENKAIPKIVFSDGIYADHPDRKKKVHDIITVYLEEIERIIHEGVQEGSINKNISPGTGAMFFLGSLMPAAILGNVLGDDIDILAHSKEAWLIFERSIVVDKRILKDIDGGKANEDT